jgi:hypothetical protein
MVGDSMTDDNDGNISVAVATHKTMKDKDGAPLVGVCIELRHDEYNEHDQLAWTFIPAETALKVARDLMASANEAQLCQCAWSPRMILADVAPMICEECKKPVHWPEDADHGASKRAWLQKQRKLAREHDSGQYPLKTCSCGNTRRTDLRYCSECGRYW